MYMRHYGINPNRFDKLWHRYRLVLGARVSRFDGVSIPPHRAPSPISIFDAPVLTPQSGSLGESVFKNGSTTQQNVTFADEYEPYSQDISGPMDPTRHVHDDSSVPLEQFFSRPVKIAEYSWSPSIALNAEFDPWSLFFDNPRVANRIANYKLLRANLKVKAVINGNGFYYGKLMMSYWPLAYYDNTSEYGGLNEWGLIAASQLPRVFLCPTTSLGGEMKLPMFWHLDYFDIPKSEWNQAGKILLRTLTNLKHANGASAAISITIFAWAEDVHLSVPTSNEPSVLQPQSGEIDEANAKGTISGPATTVAKYAAYFSGIPYIGPFAKATQIGSNAVAGMAKIFGYSRPAITATPAPMKPSPIASLALTNVPDTSAKLTVDDKQELTIDPRIAGISGVDPMNILTIAKKETYLTTFDWQLASGPDALLWNIRVDPVISRKQNTSPPRFWLPAISYAALPFAYWRGTIKYRFQIVCSAFHKGRLKIVYDPDFIADTSYAGFSEFNTNYMRIVDISEEQDFTIEVGGAQDMTFRRHFLPATDSETEMLSTTRYTSVGDVGKSNGVLGVIVLNSLAVPNDETNNDIKINVFISAGDDFEVAAPDDYFQRFTLMPQSGILAPQSGEMNPNSVPIDETSAPEHNTSQVVGLPPNKDTNVNDVFFGEAVSSFRTIAKRFNMWSNIPKTSVDACINSGRYNMYPYFRGYFTDAVDMDVNADKYNYCNTIFLHWLMWGFSGYRGSVRYKLLPMGSVMLRDRIDIERVTPYYDTIAYGTNVSIQQLEATETISRYNFVGKYVGPDLDLDRHLTGTKGEAIATTYVNGCLEFEVPYYSQYRFVPGKWKNLTSDILHRGAWDYRAYFGEDGFKSHNAHWVIYAAAGEDFQTYMFTGCPPLRYEPTPPSPYVPP
jgi:hypothetical protein